MSTFISCPNCGANIESNSRFCSQCGTRLLQATECNDSVKDIVNPGCATKTIDQVMAELDKFVDIDEYKNEIRKIANTVESARQAGLDPYGSVKNHYLFIGGPGTGKTTLARLMADALFALGALPDNKCVQCDREKLVGQYVGQSSQLVRKVVREAMGGVLFIDEAWLLCFDDNDICGKEAIYAIFQEVENSRGKFVCILAGYPKQMEQFIHNNPSIHLRFNAINFRYSTRQPY